MSMDIQTLTYVQKVIENLDNVVEIKNEINGMLEQAIDDFEKNMEDYSS